MSFQDRTKIVVIVDTALALSSLQVGVQPRLSFDLHSTSEPGARPEGLVYQINHNDSPLFDAELSSLIEDPEMRQLLRAALPDLALPHEDFQRRLLAPENSELDLQLAQRGLTGAGLELKEGGQRKAINEYREANKWLVRRMWFRSVLKWTDIVLGSLSSIPGLGVAVDPVKEWKESVEAQLDVESGRRRKK